MKNIYDLYCFSKSLTNIEAPRQFKKVKYQINETVGLVLVASLGNVNVELKLKYFANYMRHF